MTQTSENAKLGKATATLIRNTTLDDNGAHKPVYSIELYMHATGKTHERRVESEDAGRKAMASMKTS